MRRLLLLPVFLLPVFLALAAGLAAELVTGASAAASPASPGATIAACLARARADQKDPRACIGIVSEPCLSKGADPSTAGMIACFSAEHDAWDARLNATYQLLMRQLEPEKGDKLRAAQRSWIETRELSCGFFEVYFEGTMARPMIADCFNRQTAERVLFLEGFVIDLGVALPEPR